MSEDPHENFGMEYVCPGDLRRLDTLSRNPQYWYCDCATQGTEKSFIPRRTGGGVAKTFQRLISCYQGFCERRGSTVTCDQKYPNFYHTPSSNRAEVILIIEIVHCSITPLFYQNMSGSPLTDCPLAFLLFNSPLINHDIIVLDITTSNSSKECPNHY
ncbi:hypothetical protein Agabi119p4_11305 [Agaricus bisporus var. burnettii]|uniref:Uncharacterized protein n=1 Tax=Agaricus bisporus var. burnettii TaxID=192524 RepID=A0A8H7EVL4_AGABI|nr:hypothetical protein Agabi119p4_11305 [Agaricus bisporus var. burnettii]